MIAKNHLEELAKKLLAVLPENLQVINNEIQTKFNDVLQIAFTKLDLVTREEFDAQVKVLARTRAKVEAIEEQLAKFIQP
jgi:BMFP domain-containing protein YqiC